MFVYCMQSFFTFLCFVFHVRLSIVLSKSIKTCLGVLITILFSMQIAFGKMVIFITLNILIHEHVRSFYLLISSSTSFFRNIVAVIQVFQLCGQSYCKIFFSIYGYWGMVFFLLFLSQLTCYLYIGWLLTFDLFLYPDTLLKMVIK